MSKSILRRVTNRIVQIIARFCPGSTTLRPALHRWRGVKVGQEVFIGDDVYLDNEWPERIEIQDNVQISMRSIVIAHTRGPGQVIIEREAFVGPNCVLVAGAGRVLRIGTGAVVGAGSVITKSVPPRLYVAPPAVQVLARARISLPSAETMEEFWAGLEPLERQPPNAPWSNQS
jgi:acetyltransferase-like isoleucine patch superfamily enzyme